MAKKKVQNKKAERVQQEERLSVLDHLNQDVLAKLKEKQQELALEVKRQQELEEERKRQERKQREKNKSYAELLEESNLDWKKFK